MTWKRELIGEALGNINTPRFGRQDDIRKEGDRLIAWLRTNRRSC